MDGLDLETVPDEVDALIRELEAERGRAIAGVAREPVLSELFRNHSRAAHKGTATALREVGKGALADKVWGLRTERSTAELEEAWWAAEARATGVGPDGPAPLSSLELALAREPDRTRRQALAQASVEALAPAASAREALLEGRARGDAEAGLMPDWRAVVEGDAFLAATDDAYADVLGFWARREPQLARVPSGDLTRADLLYVLSLRSLDGLFPRSGLEDAIRRTAALLKLPVERIKFDEGERTSQWPGVHVTGERVSFRPRGGAGDWQDILTALGPALAAAHVPPHRRETSLGGALGWLLGSLLFEPRWLERYAGVDRRQASDACRGLGLRRLFGLRTGAAAIRVASEVRRGLSGAAWREAYKEALTDAARASWDGARAARDGDAAQHAEALAGAGAGEQFRREVRERYDEDWWRNPRTAELLAGLLAAGALPPAQSEEVRSPATAGEALSKVLEGG